jgi:hypothetical protein
MLVSIAPVQPANENFVSHVPRVVSTNQHGCRRSIGDNHACTTHRSGYPSATAPTSELEDRQICPTIAPERAAQLSQKTVHTNRGSPSGSPKWINLKPALLSFFESGQEQAIGIGYFDPRNRFFRNRCDGFFNGNFALNPCEKLGSFSSRLGFTFRHIHQ